MSARDVIEGYIRAGYQTRAPGSMVAGDAIRALEAAGYAVVELPPEASDGGYEGVEVTASDEIWISNGWVEPDQARVIAAGLLRAADQLEAIKAEASR